LPEILIFASIFQEMIRLGLILGLLVTTGRLTFAQGNLSDECIPVPFTETHSQVVDELLKSLTRLPAADIKIDTIDLWKKWRLVENYSFGKDRGSIPMITELNALHPYFRDKISELIQLCRAKGIELAVVETFRTRSKQNEYKSMGRKYTRSGGGSSKHQYGLAVDLVPIVDSVAVWDNVALWRKIGVAGEKLGLRWGGRWKKPYDPGHFEWTGGLNSNHFASGIYPLIPAKENYPCVQEDIHKLKSYWAAWETEQSSFTRKEGSTSKMK
jgi:hypothetical protein